MSSWTKLLFCGLYTFLCLHFHAGSLYSIPVCEFVLHLLGLFDLKLRNFCSCGFWWFLNFRRKNKTPQKNRKNTNVLFFFNLTQNPLQKATKWGTWRFLLQKYKHFIYIVLSLLWLTNTFQYNLKIVELKGLKTGTVPRQNQIRVFAASQATIGLKLLSSSSRLCKPHLDQGINVHTHTPFYKKNTAGSTTGRHTL